MSTYALALDVGGTFTDVMLMHRESGQIWITKTPSTPSDPSAGFFVGVEKMLQRSGAIAEAIAPTSFTARPRHSNRCTWPSLDPRQAHWVPVPSPG